MIFCLQKVNLVEGLKNNKHLGFVRYDTNKFRTETEQIK